MKITHFFLIIVTIAGLLTLYAEHRNMKQDDIIDQDVHNVSSKIQLFMYEDCFYCIKVKLFIEKYNLVDHIQFIDATIIKNKNLLKIISGKTQAPYLVDQSENIYMAESEDIIAYLIKKFNIHINQADNKSVSNIDNHEKQYDQSTFLFDISKITKPVVILVSTTWCPPCKVFKPIFIEIAQKLSDKIEFILIDGDTHADIVQQLGVRSYPTVLFYQNGQRIDLEYTRSKVGFMKALQNLL